jgi:hypothetical protein
MPFTSQVDTNTVDPSIIRAGVNENSTLSPPELSSSGFGHQGTTLDPYGTIKGNNGVYGANVLYRFEAINSDEENDHAAFCKLVLRNNVEQPDPDEPPDATFFGAAYIIDPTGRPKLGVPALQGYGTVPPGYTFDYINLGEVVVPEDTPAESPVSGVIALANAGASPLPINLTVENVVDVPP